jgi:3-isopropylmalate/(R)-2-methylmalate dehydratase small subunit
VKDTNRPSRFTGTLWRITDATGKLIDNIDTDMIFHNAHLHITEVNQMGAFTFGNLSGWTSFPQEVKPGDLVMVGKNFGAGSSRQQAVDCFRALGVAALIAESYGAIYKRNAINSGMPIIEAPGLSEDQTLQHGMKITLDLISGLLTHERGSFLCKPMSDIQANIYQAGSLFAYGSVLVGQ